MFVRSRRALVGCLLDRVGVGGNLGAERVEGTPPPKFIGGSGAFVGRKFCGNLIAPYRSARPLAQRPRCVRPRPMRSPGGRRAASILVCWAAPKKQIAEVPFAQSAPSPCQPCAEIICEDRERSEVPALLASHHNLLGSRFRFRYRDLSS